MKVLGFAVVAASLLAAGLGAQEEEKPVPKNSVRVYVAGCSKGYVFTAGARTEDRPGVSLPIGTHLRISGPKALIAEIKAREGSRIEISGLIKKGQIPQDGVRVAPGVRITGAASSSGRPGPDPGAQQIVIDVEGWRQIVGDCSS